MLTHTRFMLTASLLAAAMLLTACQSTFTNRFKGLPTDDHIVGGGYQINYVAPDDGTAIWANRTTGQMVITRSLVKGEAFDFTAAPDEIDTQENFGQDVPEARMVLYFVPNVEPVPAPAPAPAPASEEAESEVVEVK